MLKRVLLVSVLLCLAAGVGYSFWEIAGLKATKAVPGIVYSKEAEISFSDIAAAGTASDNSRRLKIYEYPAGSEVMSVQARVLEPFLETGAGPVAAEAIFGRMDEYDCARNAPSPQPDLSLSGESWQTLVYQSKCGEKPFVFGLKADAGVLSRVRQGKIIFSTKFIVKGN